MIQKKFEWHLLVDDGVRVSRAMQMPHGVIVHTLTFEGSSMVFVPDCEIHIDGETVCLIAPSHHDRPHLR